MKETEFVLASNSPRRKELLSSIVDRFDVRSADVDERLEDSPAPDLAVKILAKRKADAVYRRVKDCYGSGLIVLGCDTVVAYKGKILGKPRDEAEAKQMLSLLSGKTHTVYTGVCFVTEKGTHTDVDRSYVTFHALTKAQIEEYVKSGSPMDKAGAYGIQDGVVVDKFTGSYSNIVGLPLELTERMLKEVIKELC